MGVTDKAVSKWERDIAFPDVALIPKLAVLFDVSADELLQVKAGTRKKKAGSFSEFTALVLKSVALAKVLQLFHRDTGFPSPASFAKQNSVSNRRLRLVLGKRGGLEGRTPHRVLPQPPAAAKLVARSRAKCR